MKKKIRKLIERLENRLYLLGIWPVFGLCELQPCGVQQVWFVCWRHSSIAYRTDGVLEVSIESQDLYIRTGWNKVMKKYYRMRDVLKSLTHGKVYAKSVYRDCDMVMSKQAHEFKNWLEFVEHRDCMDADPEFVGFMSIISKEQYESFEPESRDYLTEAWENGEGCPHTIRPSNNYR